MMTEQELLDALASLNGTELAFLYSMQKRLDKDITMCLIFAMMQESHLVKTFRESFAQYTEGVTWDPAELRQVKTLVKLIVTYAKLQLKEHQPND